MKNLSFCYIPIVFQEANMIKNEFFVKMSHSYWLLQHVK